jgi:predicted MPP superfamily phosphohydrolase
LCKSWENRFIFNYFNYYGKQSRALGSDEPIRLLQIGDLEFGGPTAPGANIDMYSIPNHLQRTNWIPHVVAICGDISYSGKADEFIEATEWIDKFSDILWNDENDRRFLVAPGNHDCDFDAFAQFCYNATFPKEGDSQQAVIFKLGEKNVIRQIWDSPSKSKTLEETLFSNYKSFAERFLGKFPSITRTEHMSIINDSFSSWGVRVIYLNTMSNISPDNLHGFDIHIQDIKDIAEHCVRHNSNSLFTIIIAHYRPIDLGYLSNIQADQNKWSGIVEFLNTINAKLWLCAHTHGVEIGKVELSTNDRFMVIPYVVTSTLRLKSGARKENHSRAFMEIDLQREDGVVNSFTINQAEIKSESEINKNTSTTRTFSRRPNGYYAED